MMETIYLQIAGTTSAVKHFLPLKDRVRLIDVKVACNAAQAGEATITVGKDGAATTIKSIDLQAAQTGNYVAGTVYTLPDTASLTEGNKNQIFGGDVPLCITPDLTTAGSVMLAITVDPFLIGPHTSDKVTTT